MPEPTENTKIITPSERAYYCAGMPYRAVIEPDECNDKPRFIARYREFPGCMAQGETPELARQSLIEMLPEYIQCLLDDNLAIPSPVLYDGEDD